MEISRRYAISHPTYLSLTSFPILSLLQMKAAFRLFRRRLARGPWITRPPTMYLILTARHIPRRLRAPSHVSEVLLVIPGHHFHPCRTKHHALPLPTRPLPSQLPACLPKISPRRSANSFLTFCWTLCGVARFVGIKVLITVRIGLTILRLDFAVNQRNGRNSKGLCISPKTWSACNAGFHLIRPSSMCAHLKDGASLLGNVTTQIYSKKSRSLSTPVIP